MILDFAGSPFRKLLLFACFIADIFLIVGITRILGYSSDQVHDHLAPIILGGGAMLMLEGFIAAYLLRDRTGVRVWSSPLEWLVFVVVILGTIWLAYTT